MNSDSTIKEYVSHKLKKKAKNFGIDFGDNYNKRGIVKPKFVLPLLTLGIGAAFGLTALKKRLNNMQNKMQNRMNNQSYFYQDKEKTSLTPQINELKPISNMIRAIIDSINQENYTEFIKNSSVIVNFFDSIDLSDKNNIFNEIVLEDYVQHLNDIIKLINTKEYKSYVIDSFEQYNDFVKLLTECSTNPDISLVKVNRLLLQKISSQEFTEEEFNNLPKNKSTFALLRNGRNTNNCSIIFIY